QKLDHEEGIAGGLLMHQLSQRRGALRLAAKRICNQFPKVFRSERRKRDRLDLPACVHDRLELPSQRMRGVDLVVAVGPDQHQILHIRPGEQILDKVERRRVEPLQIVEEERQRMFGPGEYADEAPEHELETALRLLR